MISYPLSILAYFVLGALGASAFLIILLLFDKDVAILKNKVINSLLMMGAVYVVFGGVLAAVANVATNPDFGPNQYVIGFATGLGWPAIATGIGAGKRVGEINEEKKEIEQGKEEAKKILLDERDQRVSSMEEYFGRRLQDLRTSYQTALDQALDELEKARTYYSKRLSTAKGGA